MGSFGLPPDPEPYMEFDRAAVYYFRSTKYISARHVSQNTHRYKYCCKHCVIYQSQSHNLVSLIYHGLEAELVTRRLLGAVLAHRLRGPRSVSIGPGCVF
jgi:hypothetical protein